MPIVLKYGSLNHLEPSEPVQACNEIALPLLYPLYRRLGGPQGRSRQVRKISPPPGFDPRTFQSVASRYTDYATWPEEEVWTGEENLASTGIQSPDRPARNQSLYRVRYPAPNLRVKCHK
jgi:hypothetical protein